MDALNVVAALVTFAAFGLALRERSRAHRQAEAELHKVALQRERLSTARAAAAMSAETSHLIVQKLKTPGATQSEIQDLARVVRGNLRLLVHQLDEEDDLMKEWQYGRLLRSNPPPREPPDV